MLRGWQRIYEPGGNRAVREEDEKKRKREKRQCQHGKGGLHPSSRPGALHSRTRLMSARRRTRRCRSRTTFERWLCLLALLLLVLCGNVSGQTSDYTLTLDLTQMGNLDFVGAFDGFTVLQPGASSTLSAVANTTGSLLRLDGSTRALSAVATTDVGGSLAASCTLTQGNTTYLFIGGNFTTLGNTSSPNIARYNLKEKTFVALDRGLDGPVRALYCNRGDGVLYIGGSFRRPLSDVGNKTNSAITSWNGTAFRLPAFGAIQGQVETIVVSGANSSQNIIVGGSFSVNSTLSTNETSQVVSQPSSTSSSTSQGASGSTSAATSRGANSNQDGSLASSGQPSQLLTSSSALSQATQTPLESTSTSAAISNTTQPTGGSAALASASASESAATASTTHATGSTTQTTTSNMNLPDSNNLAPISIAYHDVHAGPTTYRSGFGLPWYPLCPRGKDGVGSSWLLVDRQPGYWEARLHKSVDAVGVRLGNTFFHGRGLQEFQILLLPHHEIQTLAFTDPDTGLRTSCSHDCRLAHNESIPYQDFLFTSRRQMTGFRIELKSWYGAGAGLHLIQLLGNEILSSAVDASRQAQCKGLQTMMGWVNTTGDWSRALVRSDASPMAAHALLGKAASASTLTWTLPVLKAGAYDLKLFTPGCLDACQQRTTALVNVRTSPNRTTSVLLDQRVARDSVATVYSGVIGTFDDAQFQAVITMTAYNEHRPLNDSVIIGDLMQVTPSSSAQDLRNATSIGNGIFEYTPHQNSSVLNKIAQSLPTSAKINAIARLADNSTLIGGLFEVPSAQNLALALSNGSLISTNGGLNNGVHAFATSGSAMYVCGSFNATADSKIALKSVAKYENHTWSPLEGGLDGACSNLATFSNDTILLSGNFTSTSDLSGNLKAVSGIAYWNTTSNSWLSSRTFIVGRISSAVSAENATASDLYLAGQVATADTYATTGLASLGSSNANLSISFLNNDRMDSQRIFTSGPRMTTTLTLNASADNVIRAGLYYNQTDASGVQRLNRIIAGHFTSGEVSNIGIIEDGSDNLAPLAGGTIQGDVLALCLVNDTLVIGGAFTLTAPGGITSQNLAVYDLQNSKYASNQISVGESSDFVSILQRMAETDKVIVGGLYHSSTQTPCNSICVRDLSTSSWLLLGQELQGQVNTALYVENPASKVIVGGALSINGVASAAAVYDLSVARWGSLGTQRGTTNAMVSQSQTLEDLFLAGSNPDGSVFITHWNGSLFSDMNTAGIVLPNSTIYDLSIMAVQTSHASSDLFQNRQVLAVSGNLSLVNYGPASSVLFDGTSWHPLLQTNMLDGSPGNVMGTFTSNSRKPATSPPPHTSPDSHLSLGLAILIALAAALGLVLMIILVAEVISLWSKRRRYALLTRTHEQNKVSTHRQGWVSQVTEAVASISHGAQHEHKGGNHLALRRYGMPMFAKGTTERTCAVVRNFNANEPGEVELRLGDRVEVLDDSDPIWWSGIVTPVVTGKNIGSGMRNRFSGSGSPRSGTSRRGVFPAFCVISGQ